MVNPMYTIHLCAASVMKRKDSNNLWIVLLALAIVALISACSNEAQNKTTVSGEGVIRLEEAQPTPTMPDRETAAIRGATLEGANASAEQFSSTTSASAAATSKDDDAKLRGAESESEPEEVVEIEVPGEVSYAPGYGPVSLEERILRADMIARATLTTVSTSTPGVYDYPGRPMPSTRYVSVLEMRFDVHEYLKGSGGDTLIVDLPLSNDDIHESVAEALKAAGEWLSDRDPRWDDREAIVFLQRPVGPKSASSQSTPSRYVFPLHRGGYSYSLGGYGSVYDSGTAYAIHEQHVDTYSIRSEMNRVWLPATSAPGASGGSGASETRYYLEEPSTRAMGASAASSQHSGVSTISLSDLKSRVKAMDDLLKQGEGVAGYRECLVVKHFVLRRVDYQELIATGPGPYLDFDVHTSSGLPAGSVVSEGRIFGGRSKEYSRDFFTGPDADLFLDEVKDNDNDASTGYSSVSKIRRPLPSGKYEIHHNSQPPVFVPCNFVPEPYSKWFVNVTAPRGTLHEAFFDPVVNTSTSAVGADGSLGALKPTDFRVTGYSGFRRVTSTTTVKGLYWENNKVRMEFAGSAPRTELSGSFMDVIGLDGKVSLTLDFNKSALSSDGKSLSWDASKQPWKAGDKLMLRIREGMAGVGGESGSSGVGR